MIFRSIATIFAGFFLLGLTAVSRLEIAKESLNYKEDNSQEVLYLPNGTALKLVSFGYSNALAQLLWFQTISYFGKHYRQDQSYEWLNHYCKLVTTLNPKMEHPYSFCAQMLAWEAGRVGEANSLLTKAIEEHPEEWYFVYLRGLNHSYFLKDQVKARDDFILGSKIADAPPMMARLAAKTIQQLGDPETAVEFLEEAILRESDPAAKAALQSKLVRIKRGGKR